MPKPFVAKSKIDPATLNQMALSQFASGYLPGTTPNNDSWIIGGYRAAFANSNTIVDNSRDWRDRMCLHGLVMEVTDISYAPGNANDDDFDGSNNLRDASGVLDEITKWYTGPGGAGHRTFTFNCGQVYLWVDDTTGVLYFKNLHAALPYFYHIYLRFSGDHDEH
jgi:hypothetical protein